MLALRTCPDCGIEIPDGHLKALCPQCALCDLLHDHEENSDPSAAAETQGRKNTAAAIGESPAAGASAVSGEGLRGNAVRTIRDYELIEEIGRGGMGVVFKARQKPLDRLVAVKLLLAGPHADSDAIRRFRIEAVAAGALHHPNIVAIHEVAEHGGQAFYAMELVDGQSIAERARHNSLPPAMAADYLRTIAMAIQYAHEQGIIHRDLKPSNVLIDARDQPRITDFGLAKRLDADNELTESGQVLGSPGFMSPEQASGRRAEVGTRTDVYGLGAILYYLLTGRPPFHGASLGETLHQVVRDDPVSPRQLNPGVPKDLATICLKCLAKRPEQRYGSAGELAEELSAFLRDDPIRARPVTVVERTWRWCRRNPVVACLLAALGASLVLSLVLLLRIDREKDKQRAVADELKSQKQVGDRITSTLRATASARLENLWTETRRSMEIESEIVAALSLLPIRSPAKSGKPLRWRIGISASEYPVARLGQHGKLLSELEIAASNILSQEVRINVVLYKKPEDFHADLYAGQVDFGRMAALPYVRSRRIQPALIPLAMPTFVSKRCLLFTRTNSGIRTLADVRGRSVAFGDTNATVSFQAQIRLLQAGISGTNLAQFDFLDSTQEFEEDVQEVGLTNALSKIGYLHSHAEVIQGVLDGRYDVGVCRDTAFRIRAYEGLVSIQGTDYESSRNLFVARPDLDHRWVTALRSAITGLSGHWMESLPDQSFSYQAVDPAMYATESEWLDRVEAAFPPKPSPPHIPKAAITK